MIEALSLPTQSTADGAPDGCRSDLAAVRAVDLGEALRKDWIEFWYQPKIDLRKKQLAGVEVLARVHHPELGILAPDTFLPGATESELVALSEKALASALDMGSNLFKLGLNLRFTVNMPVPALGKPGIAGLVCS